MTPSLKTSKSDDKTYATFIGGVLALAWHYLVLMYKGAILIFVRSVVLIAVLYFPVIGGRPALPVALLAAVSLFSLPMSPLLPP
jgi:uncharacterized membrane protein YgaE (UPF0421/DUF939 family)